MNRFHVSVAALILAAPSLAQAQSVTVLPDIDITTQAPIATRPVVVGPAEPAAGAPAPVAGSFIDKTPSDSTRIDAAAIARTGSPFVSEALNRAAPSIDIQSSSGNVLQPDVSYRGFEASPIAGTPQGLAVYQNGVRINEAFGDIVNLDLIPTLAVSSIDLISNDPAFGLNALGGALNVRMKDGFNYHGGKLDVLGGSYGRIQGGLDYGKQIGDYAFYGALEGVHDGGYRKFGDSNLERFYGDLGYRAEGNELHLNVGLAHTRFGASGPAPIELLQQDWSKVYTTPQTSDHQMGMLNLTGRFTLSPTWTLNANAYVRRYIQRTVDGNPTDVQPCDPNSGQLCFNDPAVPANGLNGGQLNNPFPANATLGEIDRSTVRTTSVGAGAQLSNSDKIFGFTNHFSVGSSFDFGQSNYSASAELGTVGPDYVVTGSGIFLGQSGAPFPSIGPVNLDTINRYAGFYALDAFDVSDKLTISAGARLNIASISLFDQIGGALSGEHEYSRINPLVGFTYKITNELQAYGSYAEANRAPTPLELGCADPTRPCIIASFLVADPSLQQVVSRTYEAGLRGQHAFSDGWGSLGWKLGAFQTRNSNDILNEQSPIEGFGYFTNIGGTRRQGVETAINYRNGPWDIHASYAYIDATFRSAFQLNSFSPSAVGGLINVNPGDQIPMIPRHRIKVSADYDINSRARVGADFLFTGPQRSVGDESNQQPQLPSYFTVSLNGSYKFTDSLEVYGRIDNLLNRRYYTYGTYFDITNLPFGNGAFSDARSLTPAQPLSVYGGVRYTFDAPSPMAATTVATKY